MDEERTPFMEKHIPIVGTLWIVFSVLWILLAVILFVILAGAGMISGDENAMAILAIIGSCIAFFLIVISIPGIVGGIWLMKRKEWARILVLILAFLNLVNVPFGTAIGVYSIWALMNSEMVRLFAAPAAPPPAAPATPA
jgi:hypothetical protein